MPWKLGVACLYASAFQILTPRQASAQIYPSGTQRPPSYAALMESPSEASSNGAPSLEVQRLVIMTNGLDYLQVF
jgi:hypothetical protein